MATSVPFLISLTPAEADALIELARRAQTDTRTLAHRLLVDSIQRQQGAAIGGSNA